MAHLRAGLSIVFLVAAACGGKVVAEETPPHNDGYIERKDPAPTGTLITDWYECGVSIP